MKTPKISICIPTYKRISFLKEAINSVINNNWLNFEIIVSDDDNDPLVEDLIKDFHQENIIYYSHSRTTIAENWSHVVSKAKGEYIMKMDDDDLLLPGFLEKVTTFLDKYSDVNIVFTAHQVSVNGKLTETIIDKNFFKSNIVDGKYYAFSILLNKALPRNHKSIGVFKRNIIKKINFFNDMESDIMFTIAVGSLGKIGYINEILFEYRFHNQVSLGMNYEPLAQTLRSLPRFFEYSWIKSDLNWINLRSEILQKMYFIIPMLYIKNTFIYKGKEKGFLMAKRIAKDFPMVKKNQLYLIMINILFITPTFLYKRFYFFYIKVGWLKSLANKIIKIGTKN